MVPALTLKADHLETSVSISKTHEGVETPKGKMFAAVLLLRQSRKLAKRFEIYKEVCIIKGQWYKTVYHKSVLIMLCFTLACA